MNDLRPEMLNPEFLLEHIRRDTKFDADLLEKIISEWKRYKATGMEPDMVVKTAELAFFVHENGLDRLRDLLAAEKDGRLVVLPCKVEQLRKMLDDLTSGSSVDAGETYTTGYRYGWKNGRAELLRYILGMSDGGTRDAAEAALRGEEDAKP